MTFSLRPAHGSKVHWVKGERELIEMPRLYPYLCVTAYMLPESGEGRQISLEAVAPLAVQLPGLQVGVHVLVEQGRIGKVCIFILAVCPLALEVVANVGENVSLSNVQRAPFESLPLNHVEAMGLKLGVEGVVVDVASHLLRDRALIVAVHPQTHKYILHQKILNTVCRIRLVHFYMVSLL